LVHLRNQFNIFFACESIKSVRSLAWARLLYCEDGHQSEFCLQITCSHLRNLGWEKLRTSCFYLLEMFIPASYLTWAKYALASPFRKLLGSHMPVCVRIRSDIIWLSPQISPSLSEKKFKVVEFACTKLSEISGENSSCTLALDTSRIQKKSRPFLFPQRIKIAAYGIDNCFWRLVITVCEFHHLEHSSIRCAVITRRWSEWRILSYP